MRQGSGPPDLPKRGGPLPADWMFPKTSIKFVPAEYHCQSAIAAAFELRPQIGDPARIRSIEIATFHTAVEIIAKDPEKRRRRSGRRRQPGDPARIRSIEIATFHTAVEIIAKDPEKWRPKTRETADHSLPYCTAVALADGDVTLAQFAPKRFSDPALLDLVAKVKVHRDA